MASRNISSLAEVIQAIHHINAILDKMNTKEWDFHQRRITNAAPSAAPDDYVTQKELLQGLGGVTLALGVFALKINNSILIDNSNVMIRPGRFRILDKDGKP